MEKQVLQKKQESRIKWDKAITVLCKLEAETLLECGYCDIYKNKNNDGSRCGECPFKNHVCSDTNNEGTLYTLFLSSLNNTKKLATFLKNAIQKDVDKDREGNNE